MGRLTRDKWAFAAATTPVVLLASVWLLALALGLAGRHPLWNTQPRNLAEAAAFRDGAAIVRGVRAGEQLSATAEVRGGFLSSDPTIVTPLEAAARAGREEIVRLLVDLGAPVDAGVWRRAWCSTSAAAVRAELALVRPDDATESCETETSPR